MHASIWRFSGDTDDLLQRYDTMLGEMSTAQFSAHLCLRAPDGIVIVDTCPSQEIYEQFVLGEQFRALRQRHGLPDPVALEDHHVHVAFINGQRAD